MAQKISQLAQDLKPYILPWIAAASRGGSSSSGGSVAAHDFSLHTGTIADAQAPQFLLRDGTRSLTGNLSVTAGVTIDGVDISAHVLDANAHHDAATAGTGISLAGQVISLAAGAAGAGLAHASGVLSVNVADGLAISGDNVILASSAAGAGLAYASGVLSVNVTDGLALSGDNVILASGAAGAGLAYASGVLSVNAGDGLLLSGDNVAVGVANTGATGLTVEADAIRLTSSSNPGAAASILATNGSGGIVIQALSVDGAADVDQTFQASNGNFYVGYYDAGAYTRVGINVIPDAQFDLDIGGNMRAAGYIVGRHAIQLSGAILVSQFDGPLPYNTNFYGEVNTHRGQVPTQVGGVMFRTGKFEKAVQLAVATTNLVTNPSFETTTGTAASANCTITRVQSYDTVAGDYHQKLVFASGATAGSTTTYWQAPYVTVTAATTYTYSISYKIVAAGGGTWRGYCTGSSASATQELTADGEWHRLVVTDSLGASQNIRIFLQTGTLSSAATILVDANQVEQTSYPTPYCDGSLPNHAWSGTAHASTSSRVAATVTYAGVIPVTQRFTVGGWVRSNVPSGASADVPATTKLITLGTYAAANSFTLQKFYSTATANWYCSNGAGTVWSLNQAGPSSFTADSWVFVAATYDGATFTGYFADDAGTFTKTASALTGYTYTTPLQVLLGVGVDVDSLFVLDRVATESELRAVYESDAPVFAETSTFQFRATKRGNVWADENGLFVRNDDNEAVAAFYAASASGFSWGGTTLDTGDVLIGNTATGQSIKWDDSAGTLNVDGILKIQGTSSFEGAVTLATSGGIYQGTGTFASPTTGLKIANSSGVGTITGYNAGVAQWYGSTDGKLYAGAGTLVIDASGIRITGDTSGTIDFASIRSYRFGDGTVDYGGIYGASNSTGAAADKYVALRTETNNAAADANLLVQAFNNASGGLGSILIQANDAEIALNHVNASSSSISLTATTVTANGSTIWTAGNDGASSGLNADLLDGYQSTDFAVVASANTFLARQTIRGGSGNVYSYLNPTGTAETVELRFANNDVSKGRLLYAGANSSPNKYFGFISAAEYLAMASDVTRFSDGAFSASFAYLSSAGLAIGLGSAATDALDINGTGLRIRTARTPASASAAGNQGTICWDSSYIYVCTATNTWKRAAIATW